MPITPHFQLSQTLTHVTVDIRVPHVRVSAESVEVVVDGVSFHFSSPPYLLLLTFPAPLGHDNEETAKYDPSREGGMVTVELKKEQEGIWNDLDMLGQLMRPKGGPAQQKAWGVEIVAEERLEGNVDEDDQAADLPNVFDQNRPHYGFLNQFADIFTDLVREGLASEMLQLPNPDGTELRERRSMRLAAEADCFDEDRYLGDFDVEDDYLYQCAISMQPHWRASVDLLTDQLANMTTSAGTSPSYFNAEESAKLAAISYPILSPVIDKSQQHSLLLGMLDILFAYVYDHLLTEGEGTTESSWTICTLSCTLSWLEHFHSTDSMQDVIRFSVRRSLIYPYLRNYEFALFCWDQVAAIIKSGRRSIIRCLLQVRNILEKSELHYLGNRLYIDPYLGWIQTRLSDDSLSIFQVELSTMKSRHGAWVEKGGLGLDLEKLEGFLYEDEADDYGSSSSEESDDDSDKSDDEDSDSDDGHTEKNVIEEVGTVSSALLVSETERLDILRISTCTKGIEIDVESVANNETTKTPLIQEM